MTNHERTRRALADGSTTAAGEVAFLEASRDHAARIGTLGRRMLPDVR
jgi:hypothetical protein